MTKSENIKLVERPTWLTKKKKLLPSPGIDQHHIMMLFGLITSSAGFVLISGRGKIITWNSEGGSLVAGLIIVSVGCALAIVSICDSFVNGLALHTNQVYLMYLAVNMGIIVGPIVGGISLDMANNDFTLISWVFGIVLALHFVIYLIYQISKSLKRWIKKAIEKKREEKEKTIKRKQEIANNSFIIANHRKHQFLAGKDSNNNSNHIDNKAFPLLHASNTGSINSASIVSDLSNQNGPLLGPTTDKQNQSNGITKSTNNDNNNTIPIDKLVDNNIIASNSLTNLSRSLMGASPSNSSNRMTKRTPRKQSLTPPPPGSILANSIADRVDVQYLKRGISDASMQSAITGEKLLGASPIVNEDIALNDSDSIEDKPITLESNNININNVAGALTDENLNKENDSNNDSEHDTIDSLSRSRSRSHSIGSDSNSLQSRSRSHSNSRSHSIGSNVSHSRSRSHSISNSENSNSNEKKDDNNNNEGNGNAINSKNNGVDSNRNEFERTRLPNLSTKVPGLAITHQNIAKLNEMNGKRNGGWNGYPNLSYEKQEKERLLSRQKMANGIGKNRISVETNINEINNSINKINNNNNNRKKNDRRVQFIEKEIAKHKKEKAKREGKKKQKSANAVFIHGTNLLHLCWWKRGLNVRFPYIQWLDSGWSKTRTKRSYSRGFERL